MVGVAARPFPYYPYRQSKLLLTEDPNVGRIGVYAFWDTIIEPLLEITGPRRLLEIGAAQGSATEKMLEYCERHGATLHSVDPVPQFDVAALKERHADRFVFHRDLSLNAIPEVPRFDVVFIDGDHNWHTVYNELRLIRESCEAASRRFPLVFMHDVDWPYGRRDLYYDPGNIPAEARHPHGGGGMLPGVPGLVPGEGLNARAANAKLEGGPRNGVLTAAEDFLAAVAPGVEMVRLRGLFGLAILFPQELREEKLALAEFLGSLDVSPNMARHLLQAERERLVSEIAKQDRARRAAKVRSRANRLAEANEALQKENRGLRNRIEELERRPGGRLSGTVRE